jgi:DMSO reductase anchor subunit
MLSDFYASFSATCFVVLSLWLVVVQSRWEEWRHDDDSVRQAYGVGLYFSLPGIMTLISLVDATNPVLWRTSYSVAALTGVAVFATVHRVTRHRWVAVVNRTAIALYGVVAIIAIFPNLLHITKVANRVDAVLLCVVVFLGVNVAWLLLFSPAPAAPEKAAETGNRPA